MSLQHFTERKGRVGWCLVARSVSPLGMCGGQKVISAEQPHSWEIQFMYLQHSLCWHSFLVLQWTCSLNKYPWAFPTQFFAVGLRFVRFQLPQLPHSKRTKALQKKCWLQVSLTRSHHVASSLWFSKLGSWGQINPHTLFSIRSCYIMMHFGMVRFMFTLSSPYTLSHLYHIGRNF